MRSFASRSTVVSSEQLRETRRKRARGVPKLSTVAIYASVFSLIVAVIAVGYHSPQATTDVASATTTTTESQTDTVSVDEVLATSIAASLAQATNLSVAPNVVQLAASTQIKSDLSQADNTVITKPQILQSYTESRSVITYTAKAGDTATAIAAQYHITTDTLKWANNLTSDAISEGKVLQILPTDGVLYAVKSGDTLESISDKYKVDKTRVVLYNDLDQSGITVGKSIVLPGATLPNNERPGYVAPVAVLFAGYSSGFGGDTWRIKIGTPGYDGNTYAYGNCTRYVYDRRVELGLPVGANWGNASTWAYAARNAGLVVNSTPSVGAIVQNGGGAGHVAIVESISDDGDVSVSEMNAYVSGGGFNVVSGRKISEALSGKYLYIH